MPCWGHPRREGDRADRHPVPHRSLPCWECSLPFSGKRQEVLMSASPVWAVKADAALAELVKEMVEGLSEPPRVL